MSSLISQLCAQIELPKMARVSQIFPRPQIAIDDIPRVIFEELSRAEIRGSFSGKRIAITCGSRGVTNIALIVRSIAAFVKRQGGVPFVVPAMGSHGGATAEGQKALIEGFGVTEDYIECPILSSMETVIVGHTEMGYPVHVDKNAARADGIIVLGRIKPHTDFRADYESGLMKMMTIGLGKRQGADFCHNIGTLHTLIPMFGKVVLEKTPVICGLGVLENAHGETCKLRALTPAEIITEEPKLLLEAKSLMAKINFPEVDVLVLEKFGKDISGDGMDPNITGTSYNPDVKSYMKVQRIAVLDLTDATCGACMGIGSAHVITKRLLDKIDYEATFVNAITSRYPAGARIPVAVLSDREAVQLALRTCINIDRKNPRIVRIQDTMHLKDIAISEALLPEAKNKNEIEVLGDLEEWPFDQSGNLW